MHHKHQSPIMRWCIWGLPLLLLPLGGWLLLEPQDPRTPAGYPLVQLVLALLMYSVVMIWLWCMRWTLASKASKRMRQQQRMYTIDPQQQEPDINT